MTPPYSLRKLSLTDLSLLQELSRRTFTDAFGADNRAEDLDLFLDTAYSLELLSAELSDPRNSFWLYESDEQTAGYLMVRVGENDCLHVERIYIRTGHQGKGAGKILMEKAVTLAHEAGCNRLRLGVWQQNPRAVAFYQREGFRITGEQSFLVGTDLQQDWVMERPLD